MYIGFKWAMIERANKVKSMRSNDNDNDFICNTRSKFSQNLALVKST